jgi:HEAT repeat protein
VDPKAGLDAYRSAVRSTTPIVRYAGLVALGDLRERGSLQLIEKARNDPDARVRLAAAFALYRCGRKDAGRALSTALIDAGDENVRGTAADLIGKLQEPAAIKRLKAALRAPVNLKSNRVIVQIYAAMAMLGDKDAISSLNQYSQGDALARLVALQALADLAPQESREALRYRFSKQDEYIEHRLIAAQGLGRMGSKDGFELALANTVYASKDPEDTQAAWRVPALAAKTLGEIGDRRALGRLRQMAEDDDPRVQVAACYAICRIMSR